MILVIILARFNASRSSHGRFAAITGRRGSANNGVDVPIPQKYKLDDSKLVDNSVFREIVLDIFSDYEKNILNFIKYKDIIKNEKTIFKNQVSKIFKKLLHEK